MPSRKARITKRVVDSVKPGEVVWDEDIRGFGVRCQLRNKTYVLKTRIGGRQRWFTIGTHGSPWTVEKARKEAEVILGEIAAKKDPVSKRDASNKADTIKGLATRFLDEEVDPKLKPTSRVFYRDMIERLITPKLGSLKIQQVGYSDVAKLHHDLRKTPYTANRVLAVLSSMLHWAEKNGERERNTNPTVGIQKFKEKSRERFLSGDELVRLGEAMATAEANTSESRFVIAALRLLIFTGCRRNEILNLQWEDVNLDKAMLSLPDTKTGARTVYLNAPAIELLAALPRVSGNPHVIVGNREGKSLVNLRKPWLRICRAAKIEGVRLHDLRHSFASVGASGGASLQIIGRLLGHSKSATTEKYSHLASNPVRAANEAIGQQIAAMMKGEHATVVKLTGES